MANPCFTQIHPTCIPVHGDYQSKLTLMSESLRNDGRIWVPKDAEKARLLREGKLKATDIPEEERDYYLERRYPAFGNLVPRDVASRAAKERCDAGYGVNNTGRAVYLDFKEAIQRLGKQAVEEKYGNLFEMYERIVDENPYVTPMMIYPAVHYTMGGLWVDYELQTTVKGLFAAGEANFSDHGANRLGASALMQGLSDGYFVLPYTMQNYLADQINVPHISTDMKEFDEAESAVRQKIMKIMSVNGDETADMIHRRLGRIMWEKVGMSRTEQSLKEAIEEIKDLRKEFWQRVKVPNVDGMNTELEKALRVADFLEMGELIAHDALMRNESCGGHFREEYQTSDGEAQRDDEHYAFVAAYEFQGVDTEPILHKEELKFENVELKQRNYK